MPPAAIAQGPRASGAVELARERLGGQPDLMHDPWNSAVHRRHLAAELAYRRRRHTTPRACAFDEPARLLELYREAFRLCDVAGLLDPGRHDATARPRRRLAEPLRVLPAARRVVDCHRALALARRRG